MSIKSIPLHQIAFMRQARKFRVKPLQPHTLLQFLSENNIKPTEVVTVSIFDTEILYYPLIGGAVLDSRDKYFIGANAVTLALAIRDYKHREPEPEFIL